jgi:regulatory protein
MDLLARREHSLAELREKLVAREFGPDEIDEALTGLAREGLASNARFTDAFIASRIRKGQGPIRIRAELAERGIDAEAIAQALPGAHDWRALAREVRTKRFGSAPPKDFKDRARQSRFLEYRGFAAEQIRAAMGGDDAE